jgi:hypothetical protein
VHKSISATTIISGMAFPTHEQNMKSERHPIYAGPEMRSVIKVLSTPER